MHIVQDEPLMGFCGRLLDAAAQAVSDLAEQPVYAIGTPLARVNALFVPGLDRMYRKEIESAGRWDGEGLGIAIDHEKIYGGSFAAAHAAGFDTSAADRHARLTLAGIILHELAHGIERGQDDEECVLANGVDVARDAFRRIFVDPEQPAHIKAKAPPVEPWHHGHGLPFIRAAGILHSRVIPELPLKLGHIVETESYGLSPARFYSAAMAHDGEFSFTDGTLIREIVALRPGPILAAKWRDDVFKWYRTTPMGEAETTAAEKALALAP